MPVEPIGGRFQRLRLGRPTRSTATTRGAPAPRSRRCRRRLAARRRSSSPARSRARASPTWSARARGTSATSRPSDERAAALAEIDAMAEALPAPPPSEPELGPGGLRAARRTRRWPGEVLADLADHGRPDRRRHRRPHVLEPHRRLREPPPGPLLQRRDRRAEHGRRWRPGWPRSATSPTSRPSRASSASSAAEQIRTDLAYPGLPVRDPRPPRRDLARLLRHLPPRDRGPRPDALDRRHDGRLPM